MSTYREGDRQPRQPTTHRGGSLRGALASPRRSHPIPFRLAPLRVCKPSRDKAKAELCAVPPPGACSQGCDEHGQACGRNIPCQIQLTAEAAAPLVGGGLTASSRATSNLFAHYYSPTSTLRCFLMIVLWPLFTGGCLDPSPYTPPQCVNPLVRPKGGPAEAGSLGVTDIPHRTGDAPSVGARSIHL